MLFFRDSTALCLPSSSRLARLCLPPSSTGAALMPMDTWAWAAMDLTDFAASSSILPTTMTPKKSSITSLLCCLNCAGGVTRSIRKHHSLDYPELNVLSPRVFHCETPVQR